MLAKNTRRVKSLFFLFFCIFLFFERYAYEFKKSFAFFFVLGRGNESDGKSEYIFDVFVRRFRENSVFFDSYRQIPDIVHRPGIDTTEVLGAG